MSAWNLRRAILPEQQRSYSSDVHYRMLVPCADYAIRNSCIYSAAILGVKSKVHEWVHLR